MKKLVLFFFLLWSTLSIAEPLTTDRASQWMDAMESMQKWSETHPQEVKIMRDRSQKLNANRQTIPSFSSSISAVKGTEVEPMINEVLAKHQFTSVDQWAKTGDQVMKAFTTLSIQGRDVNADMAKQMEAIKNNPNIPQERKQKMLQSMQAMGQMMRQQGNAPAADVEAVKPLVSRMQKMGR